MSNYYIIYMIIVRGEYIIIPFIISIICSLFNPIKYLVCMYVRS